MKNFDSRVYGISDFKEWHDNNLLELNPDFQRRAVWSEKAKSYLIDTILRGKPVPKILMISRLEKNRTVRVVVDGQQRLRAILEFINGDFPISRAHNDELAGKKFNTLPGELQKDFLKYELGVDLLFNMSYEDILDIFARINSYTVSLNKQELFNANYLGYFKQSTYRLGFKYVDYFIRGGILTKAKVTRMAEAELAGDLLMALTGGVQTNKSIEQFYIKYEDDSNNLNIFEEQFNKIMSYIGNIYPPEEILETNWSRVHLFYTFFTSIAHFLYGLKSIDSNLKTTIKKSDIGKIRVCLDGISSKYDKYAANLDDENIPKDYRQFITRSRRGTTDTASRIERTIFLCNKIKKYLENK